jgi:hypothetical protein
MERSAVTQLLALLVGALLGFGTSTLRDVLDRRRRRRATATAMLLEIEALEPNFRRMAADEDAGTSSFPLWYETIARTTDAAALFKPRTVHSLLLLKYRLDEVRDDMAQHQRGQDADKQVDDRVAKNRTWARRSSSAVLVDLCMQARRALRREGGTLPAATDEVEWHEPDLPQVSPPDPRPLTGWRRYLPQARRD